MPADAAFGEIRVPQHAMRKVMHKRASWIRVRPYGSVLAVPSLVPGVRPLTPIPVVLSRLCSVSPPRVPIPSPVLTPRR